MIDASKPRAGNTDWVRAVNDYDRMVADGTVTFDESGFADKYPKQEQSEATLRDWLLWHRPV